MKHRNRFAGALLGIAMLSGIGALCSQPTLAQDAPAAPATPAAPDAGAAPAAPATPAAPDTTTTTPTTPDTSATPATPATPDTTTTPATPATPDTTATPATPGTSAAPNAPATPDASAPSTPATPAASTPAAPAAASVAVPLTQLISPTPGDYSPAPTLSTGPINTAINYHALSYSNLSDNDLQVASSLHLSDRQIAKILKMAKLTNMPFNFFLRRIANGDTFPTLASRYGVSFAAFKDVSEEEKQVNDYESAEAATGAYSFKRASVLGRGFRDPGSEGSVLAETPDLNQPLPAPTTHG